ncbi:MAG: hypothetical protein WD696_06580 [Bryobacteraceae bacterium]
MAAKARVYRLVHETVDLLGGMSRFVNPGQIVLIKPNLTVYFVPGQNARRETEDFVLEAWDV